MKKRPFKKWQILLTSLLLCFISYEIIQACSDYEYFEDEFSNFAPEVCISDTTYHPFFYSDLFYYGGYTDTEYDTRFNEVNLAEWNAYLSCSVDKSTLESLLYKVNNTAIIQLNEWISGKKAILPDSLLRFSKKLNKANLWQKNFLRYLSLAKKAEDYSLRQYENSWEYEQVTLPPKSRYQSWLVAAKTEFESTNSSFLKERYWFLLVRHYFFYDPQKAIVLFETYKETISHNNMYYRTMAYAAGALKKLKQYSKANYYYSLVFDGNKLMRTVAHFSFHPQEEKDWNQALELCKNNNEKITLWQMLGIFYADEVRSMQEIYRLDNKTSKIDLLLTRYINKVEIEPHGYFEAKDSLQHVIRDADYQWICKVADSRQNSNAFLWDVSAGYLCFLKNDYTRAKTYYQKASGELTKSNPLEAGQLRILSLINHLGSIQNISQKDEDTLLPDLEWLFNEKSHIPSLRTVRACGWIRLELSKRYAARHDVAKYGCYTNDRSFFGDRSNVEQYKAFLEKENGTPYEKFCQQMATIKLNEVYTHLAMLDLYADKDLAKVLVLLSKGQTVDLPGNPFNGRLNDCHDCDHAMRQKTKYNSLTLVAKMKELKDAIAEGRDIYNNALLLGNAFYNISFYGNSRDFYEGNIVGQGRSIENAFFVMLTDNSVAHRYYEQALTSASTDEQRAKALFMMAKCERNNWYNVTFYSKANFYDSEIWDAKVQFVQWESFKKLRQYSTTKYYQMAIKECGYFSQSMESNP